jgi:bis(5'-adenosyl)-triphosphatase
MDSDAESFLFFKWQQSPEHVFYHTQHTFAQVNLKPIKKGHILVIPRRVVATLQDMTDEEAADLMVTIRRITVNLKHTLDAKGYTIKSQDGAAAGQTVPHVHWHIIPREDPPITPQ